MVTYDSLSSIRHERTDSTVRAATICGKRFEKLQPIGPWLLRRLTIFGSDQRHSGHF